MQYIIKQVKKDEPENYWKMLYWTGKKWIGHRCNTIQESRKYSSLTSAVRAIAKMTPYFEGMELVIDEIDSQTSGNQLLN
jgi:hypothetical protein